MARRFKLISGNRRYLGPGLLFPPFLCLLTRALALCLSLPAPPPLPPLAWSEARQVVVLGLWAAETVKSFREPPKGLRRQRRAVLIRMGDQCQPREKNNGRLRGALNHFRTSHSLSVESADFRSVHLSSWEREHFKVCLGAQYPPTRLLCQCACSSFASTYSRHHVVGMLVMSQSEYAQVNTLSANAHAHVQPYA